MKAPIFEHCVNLDELNEGEELTIKDTKLKRRLTDRDDVRDIYVVTAPILASLGMCPYCHFILHITFNLHAPRFAWRGSTTNNWRPMYFANSRMLTWKCATEERKGDNLLEKGLKKGVNKLRDTAVDAAVNSSKMSASWAMHWAIQVGDTYFELQRARSDPTRTGLRLSKWTEEQKSRIIEQYHQGSTALTDEEIKMAGDHQFNFLERMNFNNYSIWHHNCQIVVDRLLEEIGGLAHLRANLQSLGQFVRAFFCDSIIDLTTMYYRMRGCEADVIEKHKRSLSGALEVITARSVHYPKRQWMREDLAKRHGLRGKAGALGDHWLQSILESSLSLRKSAEFSYFERGPDGKPALKMDLVKQAVKGIFDSDKEENKMAWLKALPWLVAGFVVGTPRWAVAVMALANSAIWSTFWTWKEEKKRSITDGLEQSLAPVSVLGMSPKLDDYQFHTTEPKRPERQGTNPSTKAKSEKAKSHSIRSDDHMIERYERRIAPSGAAYFYDRKEDTDTWFPPIKQELGKMVTDLPLPRRWEERLNEDGSRCYVHTITGETQDDRPGITHKWITKKRITPDWTGSNIMPLPPGWQLDYTAQGERQYINQNENPPVTHSDHPVRQAIEDERKRILPKNWNVEWDNDRGKKYRNLNTGEIRWKAMDGPRSEATNPNLSRSSTRKRTNRTFQESLPWGWKLVTDNRGRKIYLNERNKTKRYTHPNDDRRRTAGRDWEMRYTDYGVPYWVHWGPDGTGASWWMRSKVPKNFSLKNNACGWKLNKDKTEWEWFEGGDIPHKDIPMLDLDDAAEFELREYPFLPHDSLVSPEGTFIEPLPSNWVRRNDEDGNSSYFDFENNTWSNEHPCEKERQWLRAMWEMRYTRHGRRYFLNHLDGSTFWTNPRMHKYEQQLRGKAGERQNGWKLDDNGEWVAFEKLPGSEPEEQEGQRLLLLQSTDSASVAESGQAEEAAHDLELLQSAESASADNDEAAEALSAQVFTRDWLEGISSEEILQRAKKGIEQQSKDLSMETLWQSTEWIMAHGKRLREDRRLANMIDWVQQSGASDKARAKLGRLKERRANLRRQGSDLLGLDRKSIDEAMVGVVPEGEERKSLQKRLAERVGSNEKIAQLKDIRSKGQELRKGYHRRVSGWKSFRGKSTATVVDAEVEGKEHELDETGSPSSLLLEDDPMDESTAMKEAAVSDVYQQDAEESQGNAIRENLERDREDDQGEHHEHGEETQVEDTEGSHDKKNMEDQDKDGELNQEEETEITSPLFKGSHNTEHTKSPETIPTETATPMFDSCEKFSQEPEEMQEPLIGSSPNPEPPDTTTDEELIPQELHEMQEHPSESPQPTQSPNTIIPEKETSQDPKRPQNLPPDQSQPPTTTLENPISQDPEETSNNQIDHSPETSRSGRASKTSLSKLVKAGRENLARQTSDYWQRRKDAGC